MLNIAEGVEGQWSFHWRKAGWRTALCGHSVIAPRTGLVTWGASRPNVREQFCARCAALKERRWKS